MQLPNRSQLPHYSLSYPSFPARLRGRRHDIDREPLQAVPLIRIQRVCERNVQLVHRHLERVVVVVHDRLGVGKAPVDRWVIFLRVGGEFVAQAQYVAEFMAEGVDHGVAEHKGQREDLDHARLGRAVWKEGCGQGSVIGGVAGVDDRKEGIFAIKRALELHGTEAPCLCGHLEAGCDVLAIGFGLEPIQVDKTTEGGVDWIARDTAIGSVAKRRVEEELKKFPKGLPGLYKFMMDRILTSSESDRVKAVLAAACLAYGHLKSKDIIDFVDLMAGYDETDVKDTIDSCGSFLAYRDGAVYFVHQSAKEYLLSKASIGHIFPQGLEQQHLQMALRCLEILQDELKKGNIYDLSSYGTRIGEFTRPSPDPLSPLEYSCLHWADHLIKSGACSKNIQAIDKAFCFLRDKFTYWLEALSLLGQLPVAVNGIAGMESALGAVEAKDLVDFLRDARRFVRYHKASIETASRQVYASALVFSPRCSLVRQQFEKQIPDWIVSKPKMEDVWETHIETISTGSDEVPSVACSPDGRLFAAVCGQEAKVYDAVSGECIHTLRSHKPLASVTFSPCGSMLAPGWVGKVEILRTTTFACIKTIKDTDIYCVRFSPDGRQLATVGYRGARIWNWQTGGQVHNLTGHSDFTPSATFLLKNQLITGSTDRKVKVWDLATGSCAQTLEEHDSGIWSVASSPDGKRFATGSTDRTAKIWQQAANTGEWACSQTLHHNKTYGRLPSR